MNLTKNFDKKSVITFDALGNATFDGKITASEIDAAKITGMDAITNRISALEALMGANASEPVTSFQTDALAVNGDSSFAGQSQFNGLSFFSNTTAFNTNVLFGGQVEFAMPPVFNKNTAGFAVIKKGTKKVDVVFETPYMIQPVVSSAISFEDTVIPATETTAEVTETMTDEQANEFFNQDVKFMITNKTAKGFTLRINKDATTDIRFSWIAIAIKDPIIFESIVPGLIIEPTPEPLSNENPTEVPPTDAGVNADTTPTTTPTTTDTTTNEVVSSNADTTPTDTSAGAVPVEPVQPQIKQRATINILEEVLYEIIYL